MVIIEGRYDNITGKVVKDLMEVIKRTRGYETGGIVRLNLPHTLYDEDEYVIKHNDISFSVEINVVREENSYEVECSVYPDEDVIEVNVSLDPIKEEKQYQKLYYKLQEDIRHELEHILQDYGIGDRPKSSGDQKGDTVFQHHKRPDEIPALVLGFYRKAKLQKRPIDEVMVEDLDDEISRGRLTKEEAEELLKIWMLFTKRRLPKAIYRNE